MKRIIPVIIFVTVAAVVAFCAIGTIHLLVELGR
jgi:hypothetical protein